MRYVPKIESVEAYPFFWSEPSIEKAVSLATWAGGEFTYDTLSFNQIKTYYWGINLPKSNARYGQWLVKLPSGVVEPMDASEFLDRYKATDTVPNEDWHADYLEVFGELPENWRVPLGALVLTLFGEPVNVERARAEVRELMRVLNNEM